MGTGHLYVVAISCNLATKEGSKNSTFCCYYFAMDEKEAKEKAEIEVRFELDRIDNNKNWTLMATATEIPDDYVREVVKAIETGVWKEPVAHAKVD